MRPSDWFTPAEFRLALLLFLLAVAGLLFRGGESLSPEVAAWLTSLDSGSSTTSDTAALGGRFPENRESASPVPSAGIDPNHADAAALVELPGIGPALAGRVVAARAAGPFRTPEDLLRVRGIGPATLTRLRPFLVFGDTAAVDTTGVGQNPRP